MMMNVVVVVCACALSAAEAQSADLTTAEDLSTPAEEMLSTSTSENYTDYLATPGADIAVSVTGVLEHSVVYESLPPPPNYKRQH